MDEAARRRAGTTVVPESEGSQPRPAPERLLTLPRADGSQFRLESCRSIAVAPYIWWAVWWRLDDGRWLQRPGSLRPTEIPPVVAALVSWLFAIVRHRGHHGRVTRAQRARMEAEETRWR